ncbi:hypothetical protein TI39_contig4317g00002 [Zymoseptoria brevis]|uniref:Uncharacterized protein n=1 Tax=Zymoseptoria brevis TaxID=1047168 RepID=A0A0F4GB77_9PEZI|nr:hypothetical protein TI39_contig4317g00002 [Zymoseptoria brevis]
MAPSTTNPRGRKISEFTLEELDRAIAHAASKTTAARTKYNLFSKLMAEEAERVNTAVTHWELICAFAEEREMLNICNSKAHVQLEIARTEEAELHKKQATQIQELESCSWGPMDRTTPLDNMNRLGSS